MGVVYKAEDIRLGRFVALKFLSRDVATDPHALARFRREAQAASALNHPNICTVYDIGEDNGHAYIAMEYLEGETLMHLIHVKRLNIEQILHICVEVSGALKAAHAKGIIHRDIKPANIFVTKDSQAKVLDFGLAKVAENYVDEATATTAATASRSDQHLTMSGAAIGTIAYMSPEQVRGEKLDNRTDLFSFGAVLYEMATGRLAFSGNTSGIIFDAILNRLPIPAVQLRPDIPPRLQEIMSKAMEKDRNLRYQHFSELCADLKRLERDTDAGRNSPVENFERKGRSAAILGWAIKYYRLVGAFSVFLLLAAFALVWAKYSVWPSAPHILLPNEKNLVVLPFTAVDSQQGEQVYCDGFTETVTAKLAQVNTLQVPSALEVRTRHITNIQEARTQFGANLVLIASWQRLHNSARINLSLVDTKTGHQLQTETITEPATDLFRLQDEVVLKASRMLQLQLSRSDTASLTNHGTTVPTAYDFYIQGVGYLQRYEKPENIDVSTSLLKRSVEEDPSYAQAQARLAEAYWYKYKATKEPQWAELAKRAAKKAQNLNSQLPEVQLAIGDLSRHTGAYPDAILAFQRTLQLDPESVDGYIGLGRTYDALGHSAEAEQAFRRAIEIRPTCWNCYNSLGVFLNGQARYQEAAQAWKRVTELTPDNVWGYMNVGAAYFSQGQFADASEYFRSGLKLAPNDADLYSNAGTVSFFLRRFEEAVDYFRKAIELNPQKYDYWGNLADSYRMITTEPGKAAEAYRQAIRLAELQLEINQSDSDVLSSLAVYHARINDRTLAEEYLNRALKTKPEDVDVLHDACLVSLERGDRRAAMVWLEKAVKAGYPKEQLIANPELTGLHSDPQFDRLAQHAKSYR